MFLKSKYARIINFKIKGDHGNQCILSTLEDCRRFVSIKKNKNFRSMSTLEFDWTRNFEVFSKIWFAFNVGFEVIWFSYLQQ